MPRQENDLNLNRLNNRSNQSNRSRSRNFNSDYDRSRNSDWNRTDEHFDMGQADRDTDWASNSSRGMRDRSLMNNRSTAYQSADEYGENIGQQGLADDMSNRSWRSNSARSFNSSSNLNERGGFFGKGPKGYKRSDDRIKEEVCEALYRDYHVDASNIEVMVKDGLVTLSGTVDTREAKRAAENLIEGLSGVDDVQNEIRVKREDSAIDRTNIGSAQGSTVGQSKGALNNKGTSLS